MSRANYPKDSQRLPRDQHEAIKADLKISEDFLRPLKNTNFWRVLTKTQGLSNDILEGQRLPKNTWFLDHIIFSMFVHEIMINITSVFRIWKFWKHVWYYFFISVSTSNNQHVHVWFISFKVITNFSFTSSWKKHCKINTVSKWNPALLAEILESLTTKHVSDIVEAG